jgi:hypothetical protein
LARDAIDSKDFRFRLRESSIRKYLKDLNVKDSLFWWALKLGWLLDVGFPTEGERNRGEKVYAFFHPTFQEYFAATVDDNYGFFLPSEHLDRPVKDKNNPEKYGRYRIFERQWKEVILLWLGHQEEELILQKAQFIQLLINFDDGIENKFYFYQALFIAAAGIAEFRDCPFPLVEEIVSAIVMISFGCLNDKEQEWLTFPKASAEEARKILLETDQERVVAILETQITSVYDFIISNQPLILCDLSLMLLRIEPKSSVAVNSLTQLRNVGKNWIHVFLMARHYWGVNRGYARKKIDKLFNVWNDKERNINELIKELIDINEIIYKRQYKYLLPDEEVEIAVDGNTDEINALIHNFKNSSETEFFNKYSSNTLYRVLSHKPANVNPLIEAFIEGLHSQNHMCRFLAITGLSIIGINNQAAIQALTELVQKSKDPSDRTEAVCALADIGIGNLGVFNTLLKVVRNDPDDWIRTQAVRCLAQVTQGSGFWIVVAQLKKYLQITSNRDTFNKDKSIFYRECYESIWYCAQNMTYPAFYEAWHSQEGVEMTTIPNGQSLNQADLQESLQSAIANAQLSQISHLVCIDTSKFIDPDNPAAKIYVEMVKQGCSKSDDGTPKTMQDLQVYWDLLTIESDSEALLRSADRTIVLMFYQNPAAEATESFSPTFLTNLSKFEGAICVVTDQPFDHIPLKYFAPSQPIEDVMEWIRAIATQQ